MKITKAVIPAAGLGTRFLPATKAMPKEMLPLIDRPVIQYVVEEAVESGIEDILIITGRGKRAIEDYFDESPELELYLREQGRNGLIKQVREVSSLADIHYIRQKEPKGLGDAVLRAEKHIGDEPFAVLLGDDIIRSSVPCTKQLIDINDIHHSPVLAVEQVPPEKLSSYGIIKGHLVNECLYLLEDMVEKPSPSKAPSNLGAIGRYVFTPDIFDCLKDTHAGVGGEIQLTDAIRLMRKKTDIYALCFKGERFDTGDKIGYIQAILDFALEREEIRKELLPYLMKVAIK